jgi:hypothetical protein
MRVLAFLYGRVARNVARGEAKLLLTTTVMPLKMSSEARRCPLGLDVVERAGAGAGTLAQPPASMSRWPSPPSFAPEAERPSAPAGKSTLFAGAMDA